MTPLTVRDRIDQSVFNAIYSRSLVYNTCWEDPAVDRQALALTPDDTMLVITSEKDFRIPYSQGLAAFTALQRRNIPSELLVFPDENHWVLKGANSVQWHQTVFNWMGSHLKK